MLKKKQTFLLVSLSEEKTKKLANVITSNSARKILDHLATKGEDDEVTETQISKDLKLPLSTVHYNLQQLQAGNLVDVDEFHYSEKGKEVNHYKLANKYIIIAPSAPAQSIRDKLKSLLPVALLTAGAAALIQIFSKLSSKAGSLDYAQKASAEYASRSVADAATEAAIAAKPLADEAAEPLLTEMKSEALTVAQKAAEPAIKSSSSLFSNIALWFILGAAFAVIAYLIIEKIRKRDQQ
ncbi:helix-turn-helix transcriptional regulator [Candidatus Woesearchaeota archaeon]|nr:helix-turn-helix transcriptional regulator [Candidatus Woesearchaeota archaeon]